MDEAVLAWVALFALGLGALAILVWCFHTTVQAHMRAEALLREQLTPAELEQLNRFGYLRVASQLTSGREFEIPVRGSIMVSQDGKPLMRLCIRPADLLPGREAVLAHKIHIEAAEEDYMRRANVMWHAPARAPELV